MPDFLGRQGDRISGSDEDTAGDLDSAGILADAGSKPNFRWRGWQLGKEASQKGDRDLAAR
jgi:hypothetical protein